MASANRHFAVPPGYTVTRDGRVYSTKRGAPVELKQWTNGSGYGYPCCYLYVNGKRKNYAVHRLVAREYLPARPSLKHFICHIDDDRANAHADNLEWGTPSENQYQAWKGRRALEQVRRSQSQESVPF